MDMEQAIVPITFLDDVEYNSNNDEKHFMANLNELFTNPYNINTLYRPVTITEPTDKIISCYNDTIKRSKEAFIKMNVKDLVINTLIEMISDITEGHPVYRSALMDIMISNYINNMYISDIIDQEVTDIEYIDITLANLYTAIILKIMDPFVVSITTNIMTNQTMCESLYRKYVDPDADFDKTYNSFGNTLYCNISSILRDIAEIKMSNVRRLFDVIKQTYLNMGQFASDYHIDPATKTIVSNNTEYYDYLTNEKYHIGDEGDDE